MKGLSKNFLQKEPILDYVPKNDKKRIQTVKG